MSSGRRSNAQKRKSSKAGAGARRRGSVPVPPAPVRGSAVGDVIAVLMIVVAIAMVISIVSPSSAPVTQATGEFLELSFGVGALLLPVSIILFSATFFVEEGEVTGVRVIVGLLLVVLAVLGLLSLSLPGADSDPSLVLVAESARARGGYVGGALAWSLLQLVGRPVGDVVLVGTIVAGVIVCGFSVSDTVVRLRLRLSGIRDSLGGSRERPRAGARFADAYGGATAAGEVEGDLEEPKTSFIGSRKTSVLVRGRKPKAGHQVDADQDEVEPTRLLRRKRHPDLDVEIACPADAVAAPTGGSDGSPASIPPTPVVPDFLQQAVPTKAVVRPKRGRADRRVPSPRSAAHAHPLDSSAAAAPNAAAPAVTTIQPRPGRAAAGGSKRPGDAAEGYELPPFSMLSSNPNSALSSSSADELEETMRHLQGTLQEFGLRSRVVDYVSGPLVTTFRVEMGEGERVNKIRNLEDDIALTLAAEKVRIFAPIPGTSFVGIEIPNKERQNVHLGDVLPYASGGPLEVAIGRDSSGRPVIADISKMPHMLVAGTTGSGKSVMINSMIMSLLMRTTPKQVRLIMIDPKRVEFSAYNGLPHLYVPVVTEPRQAASALQWAVSEMERRLKVFERAGARDIRVYNKMCVSGKLAEMDNPPEPMPYLVVIIDELSDLMMVAGKDVEASIVRIAQLARAAGIHLVIATQRPSANVVTGLIKSNIDSRVALKVSSGIDSRVILDETGAERLLGNGDMLFKDRGLTPKRVLGCYTSDSEINSVVEFIRDQAEPDYHEEILSQVVPGQPGTAPADVGEEDDPLVWEAAQIVVDSRLGSTSGLQRRLKVGYARAGRIMDMLEAKGVVGPPDGSKPRDVLVDKDGLEELKVAEATYREV